MMGVDMADQPNQQIVESDPNSRFFHALISDKDGGSSAPAGKLRYRSMPELLMNENDGKVIDFMNIDLEGAEYALIDILNSEFLRSCVIY